MDKGRLSPYLIANASHVHHSDANSESSEEAIHTADPEPSRLVRRSRKRPGTGPLDIAVGMVIGTQPGRVQQTAESAFGQSPNVSGSEIRAGGGRPVGWPPLQGSVRMTELRGLLAVSPDHRNAHSAGPGGGVLRCLSRGRRAASQKTG